MFVYILHDHLGGLLVRAPGYRAKGPGFDCQRYQLFWEVVGVERGLLSIVSATEELIARKRSCSGLENQDYGRRDPPSWLRDTLYPQMLALTSPTSGGRSVGIVRPRTRPRSLVLVVNVYYTVYTSIYIYIYSKSSEWPLYW
jgi:hypothetical protein